MTLCKQLLTLLESKFSEERQEIRAQSLYIISRKLIQMKIRLTYALNVIEIIPTWDVLFHAQIKQSEYVKSFESDYGVCSRYGTVIVHCMDCVLESLRDSAKTLHTGTTIYVLHTGKQMFTLKIELVLILPIQ